MSFDFYSDLAEERKSARGVDEGVLFKEEACGPFVKTRLTIETEKAARLLERPKGHYFSLAFPSPLLLDEESGALLAKEAATLLRELAPQAAKRLLVVGLGNRHMTADAVGPTVAEGVFPTAHLPKPAEPTFASRAHSVSVFIPGVRAQSGMDAKDAVSALCKAFSFDFVLAVDALAAKSPARLLRTVQISDTGISPGSLFGGEHKTLSFASLGVPVLSLGVPTVISAAALVNKESEANGAFSEHKASSVVPEDFFVSPKTLDAELSLLLPLLSDAVNLAFGM